MKELTSKASWQRGLVLWALCLVVVLQCRAQQSTLKSEEVRNRSITGRVVNESGQPLIGATVSVRPADSISLTNLTTQVNADGNFQVSGLGSGQYFVTAMSPAYLLPPPDPDEDPKLYRAGDSVRLQLLRGGVITGTVSNDNGEPVVGVRIRAVRIKDANGKELKVGFSINDKQTDDRGFYRIFGLPNGTYLVSAGGSGPLYSFIAGELDAPTYSPSSTRDTASQIVVRGGEEAIADIRYRYEQGHVVSGTIKTLGTNSVTVSISQTDGTAISRGSIFQAPGANSFAIYGLADGDYQIAATEIVSQVDRNRPELAMSEPVKVSIKGNDVTGVVLSPKTLASITGRIVLEESNLPECGHKQEPLSNETMIGLFQNLKGGEPFGIYPATVTATKDWSFLIKNLKAGQYMFTPRFSARDWYLKAISFGNASQSTNGTPTSKDLSREWTTLKSAEQLTGVMIKLSLGGTSVKGQVARLDDKPGSRLRVYLVPSERDKFEDPLRYFMAPVASDGTFSVGSIPPGKYFVLAQKQLINSPGNSDRLRLPDALEARARLRRDAESAKSELDLKPCQNVSDLKISQH